MPSPMAVVLAVLLCAAAGAQAPVVVRLDDYTSGDPSRWQSSLSPQYYREDTGSRGLSVVDDPERGKVLRCAVKFTDPEKSEPFFLTRKLADQPRSADILGVRFWAKITAPALDPAAGFRVRLRTSDTAFNDYDVQQQLGRPLPAGEWVRVDLSTRFAGQMTNIWRTALERVREITFRLDDVDTQNADFALLLSDIELVLRSASSSDYAPTVRERPGHDTPRVLLVKHRAAGFYDLEGALRAVAPTASVDVRYYRGLHFPVFDFPATREELLGYDAILLLDVDTFVFTAEQAEWLADAVASGAHLVVLGGPVSLTHAKTFPASLRAVLPVSFDADAADVSVNAAPAPGPAHPLNLGLDPRGLGKVVSVQALRPNAGAEVPWTVGKQPLVITGPCQRGRCTVVNAWAQVSTTPTGGFLTSALSDDFLRALLRYSLAQTSAAQITALQLPPASVVGGGAVQVRVAVSAGAKARLLCDGAPVGEPSGEADGTLVFSVALPASSASETSHPLRLEALQGDQVADWRDFSVEVQSPVGLQVIWERGKYTFAPGSPVEFVVRVSGRGTDAPTAEALAGARVEAALESGDGTRWPIPRVDGAGDVRFAEALPDLRSGPYRVAVRAFEGERLLSETQAPCVVVDPLVRADFFPIMSIIGLDGDGHWLDEPGIRGRVEDLLDHGFNTAAINGIGHFRSGERAFNSQLMGFAESYAQQRGMATTYEYSSFQMVGRQEQTKPCVFDPAYPAALREKILWQADAARRTPRILTVKVVDEPVAGPENMDYCEACKAEFRRRYGTELRPFAEMGEDPYARWACADFIGAYTQHGFEQSAALMREQGGPDLLLTYMATGLGYQKPLSTQQDASDWTRAVRWADFDVYPYFYPRSQRVRMVQAAFAMDSIRDIARLRQVPWGFYVELDDRNWPFQQNPREASAECAFTAIAHGAGYLNSFINTVASTGSSARPERWEAAGKAFRTIRRAGPALTHMQAVPSPLAILFPHSQQAIANGYPTPQYTRAALQAAFGSVDILHEQTALETGRLPYRCLMLLGCEYLHADLVPLLKEWLAQGGVLVCDRLPAKDHRGQALDFGLPQASPLVASLGALKVSAAPSGAGKVVFLDGDLEAALQGCFEAPTLDPQGAARWREDLRGLLTGLGLEPPVRVEYRETAESVDLVEAGLRESAGGILLTVVNHQPAAQTVTVSVARPAIRWLVDMDTLQPVEAKEVDGRLVLTLEVPGRWGRVIAGYPIRPTQAALQVQTPQVSRGGELVYRVAAQDGGAPVTGGVLLEAEVTGPDGAVVTRYGRLCAPVTGEQEVRVPVALNALAGTYQVTLRAPQAGLQAAGRFTVE